MRSKFSAVARVRLHKYTYLHIHVHKVMCYSALNHVLPLTTRQGQRSQQLLMNEEITAAELRLVYNNPDTKAKEWKIMDRTSALRFAQNLQLDLILGNSVLRSLSSSHNNYTRITHARSRSKWKAPCVYAAAIF
jgi:hypothetical protein